MRRLLDDLRLLGYSDHQLRGLPVERLMRMREQGFAKLMTEPPPSDKAA